ncbi:MAG: aldose 1-epimerase [Chitinophagaceae bacterium]|nr:aldose 1-epimerase [Chitinophagaceae bacterium]
MKIRSGPANQCPNATGSYIYGMNYVSIHEGRVTLSAEGTTAEIWPAHGALLNRWTQHVNGTTIELIDGYDSPEDFVAHAEAKGFRSCKLSPYVCRLSQQLYEYEGTQYKIGKFILNDAALHGLLYNVPFDILHHEATDDLAMLILQHRYNAEDAGYPFPFDMTVTYTLQSGKISINTEVTNRHTSTIPLADGWHPYFKLGNSVNDLHLQIATDTMLEFDAALLPTGVLKPDHRFSDGAVLENTELDNCFLLNRISQEPACVLQNPQSGNAICIYANENYPYLQVYTPPHRQSIAIENLSAAPDVFNNRMGLIELEPDERIGFSCSYEFVQLT